MERGIFVVERVIKVKLKFVLVVINWQIFEYLIFVCFSGDCGLFFLILVKFFIDEVVED